MYVLLEKIQNLARNQEKPNVIGFIIIPNILNEIKTA